jgi:Putative Zn-dependent protease, contains TPR repeats
LGHFFYRTGNYAAALNALRRAAAGSGTANDYHALGLCLRALDNLPAAAEAIEHALHLCPDAAAWRIDLALVHLARGWHGEALAELNRVIATTPDLPDAWRARARVLIAIGQHEEARADLVEALHRDPRDAESYALLAETLIHLGQTRSHWRAPDVRLPCNPLNRSTGICWRVRCAPLVNVTKPSNSSAAW